ncbi:hypothetical protein [Cesiribacter andamanensis]|uniref:Uncharacterized protein n=1 Tax=Cesiribacter andamanensis AMV16 TaxID=1279009 RepID=M7NUY3_9BACT|nr:hypothetical protein [Cesiribacter andamanensis]EMR02254.1 hypothetical protein ADICEAN_02602 [Cesiribacter andamanensis AMV16]
MSTPKNPKKVAFILGAGFSKCADIPVQAEISPLLTSEEFSSPLDRAVSRIIADFLKATFGWEEGREITALEDVFTSIDISAGTGTHLGIYYSPERLQALRRMLIYRTFQILDKQFKFCEDIDFLLRHYQDWECSFVVMNWDIVLEVHLAKLQPDALINYITPSYDWNSQRRGDQQEGIKICKMHGSSNWVYCKNCETLFYQVDEKLSLHKKIGLFPSDFKLFNGNDQLSEKELAQLLNMQQEDDSCRSCGNYLTSHVATFSFRKSFRTAAYSAIWHEAENLLSNAQKWVLIGYSMPEADFEFKHLIKSAQLRLAHKKEGHKEIDAVLYEDEYAQQKFERFFGPRNVRVFTGGLSEYVQQLKGGTAPPSA